MGTYCRLSDGRRRRPTEGLAWFGVGVAAVVLGVGLLRSRSPRQRGGLGGGDYPDYSDRSGFPRPPQEMRGAAAEADPVKNATQNGSAAPGLVTDGKPGDETRAGSPQSGELACDRCGGSGQVAGQPCEKCEGTGRVTVLVGDA